MAKTCAKEGCNFAVFSHSFCRYHQYLRQDKKKPKGLKKRKPSGEMEIFNEIWRETPKEQRVSFISGIDLNDYEGTGYFHYLFAHVLPKKQYPEYKLDKKAIVFLTIQEHNLYDMMTEKDRQEYVVRMKEKGIDVDWDRLWRFRTELLIKSREADKTSHKAV